MYDFRVPTEDFWCMSMADFLMLFLRQYHRQRSQRSWEDFNTARIAAEVRNANERVNLTQKPGGYSASELMITIQKKKPERTNGLDVIARFDSYAARVGGGS